VISVGILISLLSFFVLMLSIYLLLQKNTKKLQDLLMLGYSPHQVSMPYIKMVAAINACVLVLSVILMIISRAYYMQMIRAFGIEGKRVCSSRSSWQWPSWAASPQATL
jgi:type III secretory pathway component EscU